MIKDYGLGQTEDALKSWKINYQESDDMSVIEQLTNNIALIEFVLKDKEHVMEHLDELTEIVRHLKMFGAAAVCRQYEGSRFSPDIIHFLTEDEMEAVNTINKADGNFLEDDSPKKGRDL